MCDRPEYVFHVVAHVLGVFEFVCLGYLGIWNFLVMPKKIEEFLMYLSVG